MIFFISELHCKWQWRKTIVKRLTFICENHILFSWICRIYHECLNPMYKHRIIPDTLRRNCCIPHPNMVTDSFWLLPPFVNPFLWWGLDLCLPPFLLLTSVIVWFEDLCNSYCLSNCLTLGEIHYSRCHTASDQFLIIQYPIQAQNTVSSFCLRHKS